MSGIWCVCIWRHYHKGVIVSPFVYRDGQHRSHTFNVSMRYALNPESVFMKGGLCVLVMASTRRHREEDCEHATIFRNPQKPRCRDWVAEDCCMLSTLPSCIYSLWHGVIPTSYFIFNDFLSCRYMLLSHTYNSGTSIYVLLCQSRTRTHAL